MQRTWPARLPRIHLLRVHSTPAFEKGADLRHALFESGLDAHETQRVDVAPVAEIFMQQLVKY